MLRYTTIHHDVREKFGLTISEYMVLDSIYNQSYSSPCRQTAVEMANWLGLGTNTVEKARSTLLANGLIVRVSNGYRVSDEWVRAVVYAKGRESVKNTDASVKNPVDTIYKNKETNSEQSSQVNEIEETYSVEVDDEGNPLERKKRRDTSYLQVFQCFGLNFPASWKRNTTQIKAARALQEERGIEQIQKALSFYNSRLNDPFIPDVSSPYDLDTKWEKLLAYKNKAV